MGIALRGCSFFRGKNESETGRSLLVIGFRRINLPAEAVGSEGDCSRLLQGQLSRSNHDSYVADSCNVNANSYANVGSSYKNDTWITNQEVRGREYDFILKGFEVFSINF
jgi:hypothetical protein